MSKRPLEEIMMRCKLVLDQPDIMLLVENSSSPTSAYDIVIGVRRDETIAKAARWLGVMRRDYPNAYTEITQTILRHATSGTAQKGQEDEKALR